MKTIQPVQIWKDGVVKSATVLSAKIIIDDLLNSCTFYWQLQEESQIISNEQSTVEIPGEVLSEGNSTIAGEDYQNWDGSNDSAYQLVADSISVTIVP